jgi:hypothetical protein
VLGGLLLTGAASADWVTDRNLGPDKVELTFIAWDNNGSDPKVAFVKDLGITMTQLFTTGQVDVGFQKYWYLGGTDDAAWATFLNTDVTTGVKPDVAKIRWAVFAQASIGGSGLEPGETQVYTTNLQGVSGSPSVIPGFSTLQGQNLAGSNTAYDNFTSNNVSTGTLGSATDGSAVIKATDGSKFPFDATTGLGIGSQINFGGNFSRGTGNLIGQSSWFYYLTGSDPFDPTLPVLIDEFDNLTNDAYWGLAAASATDKAGQYFLSYNLGGSVTALEAKGGYLASNNFARLAGVLSLSSSAGKSQTVLSMTESFLRGFAGVATKLPAAASLDQAHVLASAVTVERFTQQNVSAVPETGTWLMFASGLGLLAGAQLRRSRKAGPR